MMARTWNRFASGRAAPIARKIHPAQFRGCFDDDQRADRHPAHARDQHGGQSEHRAPLRLAEPRAIGDQRSGSLEDLLDPIRCGIADHDDRRRGGVGWGRDPEHGGTDRNAGADHQGGDGDRSSDTPARWWHIATGGVRSGGYLHAAMVASASTQS